MTIVAAVSPAPAVATDRRRYPGVRAFQERDRSRFFGRRRAEDELLLRVLSVRLLLQFAPSGAGKTSLLNAGLFPRLRPHGYLPCDIRLNRADETLVQAVARSLREAARSGGLKDPVIPETAADVAGLIAGAELWSADLREMTPVLVFDQFEEVFTLRDEAFRKAFADEIGALLHGHAGDTPPQAGSARPPDVKIIISLREEYLGALEEMTLAIPDLFRERLRLPPLTQDEAKEAIVEPARMSGDWSSPPFRFDDRCLGTLIDFIDGTSERVRVIESLTLQLVCQKAEEIATAKAATTPNPELVLEDFGGLPGLAGLVHNYYKSELAKLPDRAARRRAAEMFEQGLLDPAGKRLMLEQGEIQRVYKLEPATLDQLVASRLLRREPRNDSVFFEISHDRLTEVIARNRRPRLAWWVVPALAAAVVLIALLTVALVLILSAKTAADRARLAAEAAQRNTSQALDVLLGDELVLRLREAGLSDTLEKVLAKAPADQVSNSLAQARQLRREGELAWERGTLAQADKSFTAALEVVERASGAGQAGAALNAERAQILKALGDVQFQRGQVANAESRFAESVKVWSSLPEIKDVTTRLNVIEVRLALASARERLGDNIGAESAFADIANETREMLMGIYHHTDSQTSDPFALGRTMQVYADAMLSLARVWRGTSDLKGARALAAELMRLRPLSAQARVQMGTASAIYGSALVDENRFRATPRPEDWQLARRMLDESARQFRELAQFDPRNVRMYRERTAVQLLTAEGISLCAESAGCRKWFRPGELESAESAANDAAGRFQELAEKDPENLSLLDDVVWAKETQARLRRARKSGEGTIKLLDEALAIRRRLVVDPKDVTGRSQVVSLMHTKAEALEAAGRRDEALRLIDESLIVADQLPLELWRRWRRIDALTHKSRILKTLNRHQDAAAAAAELARLSEGANDALGIRGDKARALNLEGNTLYASAGNLQGLPRRRQYELAADKYRAAVAAAPGDEVIWSNLRGACLGAAATLIDANGIVSSSDAGDKRAAETFRRCQVESSWMAWVLSDDGSAATARSTRLQTLYEDRRSLAMLLRHDKARLPEALILAEQGFRDAEVLFDLQPSAVTLDLLADAQYGLGLLREEAGRAGWEEAMRAGIVRHEQPSDKFADLIWLGQARTELANRLDAAKRPGGAAERDLARRDCQAALRLATRPDDRQTAQDCIANATPAATAVSASGR